MKIFLVVLALFSIFHSRAFAQNTEPHFLNMEFQVPQKHWVGDVLVFGDCEEDLIDSASFLKSDLEASLSRLPAELRAKLSARFQGMKYEPLWDESDLSHLTEEDHKTIGMDAVDVRFKKAAEDSAITVLVFNAYQYRTGQRADILEKVFGKLVDLSDAERDQICTAINSTH